MIRNDHLLSSEHRQVYHLPLSPEDLPQNVIVVGDPDRVDVVARHFDHCLPPVTNREFRAIAGIRKQQKVLVISSGIGSGNVDILLNELHLLANFDFKKQLWKAKHTSLNLMRIGTTGSFQEDVATGSRVQTTRAIGWDGLLRYYRYSEAESDRLCLEQWLKHVQWPDELVTPYIVSAAPSVMLSETPVGITITSPGFYAPQLRSTCLPPLLGADFIEKIAAFRFGNERVLNMEMEAAPIIGLAHMLGHSAGCCCVVVANRITGETDTKTDRVMADLIDRVLDSFIS